MYSVLHVLFITKLTAEYNPEYNVHYTANPFNTDVILKYE